MPADPKRPAAIVRRCRNCGHPLAPSQAWSCSRSCSAAIAGRSRLHEVEPCGTAAAIRRHYRRGEPIDPTCRRARARIDAERRAAGPARRS